MALTFDPDESLFFLFLSMTSESTTSPPTNHNLPYYWKPCQMCVTANFGLVRCSKLTRRSDAQKINQLMEDTSFLVASQNLKCPWCCCGQHLLSFSLQQYVKKNNFFSEVMSAYYFIYLKSGDFVGWVWKESWSKSTRSHDSIMRHIFISVLKIVCTHHEHVELVSFSNIFIIFVFIPQNKMVLFGAFSINSQSFSLLFCSEVHVVNNLKLNTQVELDPLLNWHWTYDFENSPWYI